VLHYLPLEMVLHVMEASVKLPSHDKPQATADWNDINQLTRVICVYPVRSLTMYPPTDSAA
jgi:hypothetical protein